MRYRYAAILCSSGWLERKLMVVSVEVGLWKMLMFRQVGLLVIERSRKLMLFADSIVGLSWMLLWIVSKYCRILSGLVRTESSMSKMPPIHQTGKHTRQITVQRHDTPTYTRHSQTHTNSQLGLLHKKDVTANTYVFPLVTEQHQMQ